MALPPLDRLIVPALLLLPALLIALLLSQTASAQQGRSFSGCPISSANSACFQAGEELQYEVSYLGIGLGTISTRVNAVQTGAGERRISAECLIRTYKGVPFVTLNTLFQTVMGDSLESLRFRNREYLAGEKVFKEILYTFPKNLDRVYISEEVERHPEWAKQDTLELEGKRWQDGLSLFYYARAFSHDRRRCKVPVLMYRTKATTEIHFGVKEEEEDIDAVEYDIRCTKLEGETGFTGIFGLTGGFEGWFSDDEAAIPIRAKMHVLIGSINIELVKWKRKGWKPPRAED
ncbi:MAG: DUF3108 domain-containing protein [Bacteroidetes bacterium]|nr:DUF3108 domain-containing protein [Bacteroidota bacterium]